MVSYGDHKSVTYSVPSKAMCFLSRSSRHDELMAEVHTAMNTSEDDTKLTLFGRYPSMIPGGQVLFVSVPLTDNKSWLWFLGATSVFQPVHVYVVAENISNGSSVQENQRVVQGGPLLKRCANGVGSSRLDANDNTLGVEGKNRANAVDEERVRKIRRVLPVNPLPEHNTRKARSSHALNGGNAAATAARDEQKKRRLEVILSQLTPRNSMRVLEQVKDVNIDSAECLAALAQIAYNKAVMDPAFCEMLVDNITPLDNMLPAYFMDNKVFNFTSCLSDCCRKELQRGKGDVAFAVHDDWIRKKSKLGNVELIGELYMKKLVEEGIVHSCIKKILWEYENPDEADIEVLCNLMYRVGESMDNPEVNKPTDMDMYFEEISRLSKHPNLSSKLKNILVDLVDLRKNKWQHKPAYPSHLTLNIKVMDFGGLQPKFTLKVKSSDTIYDIKEMIKAKEGFLMCKQWLYYNVVKLADNYTVAHYNLQNNCTIQVHNMH
ncbi:unnamed protein product [Cuscuta campestris]|uniref:Ubiquitin-like domain-containing protein n=1 Tax=Cuscuta campestris TaxID=132261 RepID=A0A484MC05_9ASTE|nr:unnamed protein product [Cuscuta campestris]